MFAQLQSQTTNATLYLEVIIAYSLLDTLHLGSKYSTNKHFANLDGSIAGKLHQSWSVSPRQVKDEASAPLKQTAGVTEERAAGATAAGP